ncbi:uncharacterized protein LOC129567927 [Sitodiplosis mosellana]|uniref:uncharacterized protein LOC129567927 n=1 Tax=Sitodiplosis mosellana TaxID=263140 RepID=UPI0024439958|nr:uncharacterized protein LOC129567927 [Sitodiplosis mosellana]
MDSITLQSCDGKNFEIDRDAVKYIGMINDMLQNVGEDGLDNEAIKIPQVDSIMLDRVLKWAAYRKNEDQTKVKDVNFERDFIKENNVHLFELINIANYLDFSDMLHSLCRSVALKVKNKSTAEIRREFGITEM